MAFTNRHAPTDTAIAPETMQENIDAKGVGRYYPEEYSGPIQAANNRGQLIADVPKTLAGIVLNYDEHALSTWQANQEIYLHDKDTVNNMLVQNRKQQMELSTDLELYDAQQELESQIFQARQRVANLGGSKEEEAVNEVIELFKDKFQGRIIPDQKWQGILNYIGNRNLAEARQSDIKSDVTLASFSMQNAYDSVFHSVVGMTQNPDGTFKPIMDIQVGMDELVKRITPFITRVPAKDRPQIMQDFFNGFVKGQAQSLVELYRGGQLSSDALMTSLADLRNTYGEVPHDWTFLDNGQPLKDANNEDITVSLSLTDDTELFLLKAYKEAKSGIGNGGDVITDNAITDFKNALDWKTVETQGWSDSLLSYDSDSLQKLFASQLVNIVGSTASDTKKLQNVDKLWQVYNQARMVTRTRELINELGPNALKGIRQTIQEIDNKYLNERSTFPWQNYQAPVSLDGQTITVNGQDFTLGLSPMDPATIAVLQQQGVDMSLVAPKLGDTSEEAAMYWKNTSDLLKKYADYLENNNMGEVLNITDKNVRANFNNAVDLLTPSQMFTYAEDKKTITGLDPQSSLNFQTSINNAISKMQGLGAKTYIPVAQFDAMINQLNKNPNKVAKIQGLNFIVSNLKETPAASDIYSYTHNCIQNGKSDGGLLSMDALLNNEEVFNRYLTAVTDGNTKIQIGKTEKEQLQNVSLNVKRELDIPLSDYNAYKSLDEWCQLAAYDPTTKKVDENLYKEYLTDCLKDQYIDLKNKFFKGIGGTAFDTTRLYKNHKALIPYANNMDRLKDIGTEVKRQMTLSNLPFSPDRNSDIIPGYLKDEFKNVVLTPDEETGMWYLTKDGAPIVVGNKKVGIVYDDPELFSKVKPKDIAELALNNLVSNSSINKYEDYKKYVQKNQKLSEKIYGAMLGVDASNPKINPYLMSEEEFTKLHAGRTHLLEDKQAIKNLLFKYSEKDKRTGSILNVKNRKERK